MALFIKNITGKVYALNIFVSKDRPTFSKVLQPSGQVDVSDIFSFEELVRDKALLAEVDAKQITITAQNDEENINVSVDSADVTASGGATTATVGFKLSVGGAAVTEDAVIEFAVFDEEELVTPNGNATLDTATVGTILDGAGTNALKVKTDSGQFKCTLTNLVDETVYLGCSMSFGSPILDCREVIKVTFSA